jgi:hypothetical protein
VRQRPVPLNNIISDQKVGRATKTKKKKTISIKIGIREYKYSKCALCIRTRKCVYTY